MRAPTDMGRLVTSLRANTQDAVWFPMSAGCHDCGDRAAKKAKTRRQLFSGIRVGNQYQGSRVALPITKNGRSGMLAWAIIFLILAIVAGVLGFTGIAVAFAAIAKILFYIFALIFVAVLIIHLVRGRAPPPSA